MGRTLSGAQQKPTLEEYTAEVVARLDPRNERVRAETAYNFNMRSAQSAAQQASFASLVGTLRALPSRYLNGDPELLFYPPDVKDDLRLGHVDGFDQDETASEADEG